MYKTYFWLILLALFMVSCGKKGPLQPLEESDYPRTYPKPLDTELPPKQNENEVEK